MWSILKLVVKKAIIVLFIALFALPSFGETTLKVGAESPFIDLPNLKGEIVSLEKSLGKEVIVLSFFASWSKSCQEDLRFLQKLSENKKVKVIGVSFDRKLEELKEFTAKNKITFEVLYDKKLTTLKKFRLLIIPTTFVIDQEGKIKSIYVDFDKNVEEALNKDIKQLLVP